jgi:L-threonylcarbamoyladenylate synthase
MRLYVDPERVEAAVLEQAADWLRTGGLVVYPTDTFYGVAADATSPHAIAALFQWKGRDDGLALPFVAASVDQVEAWAGALDDGSRKLAAEYWPGPVSLILPAPATIAPAAHAGRGTVAVRVPAHRVARVLAAACGTPIPATSANRSGTPAVIDVDRLGVWLDDPRVLVIDAGLAPGGLPSTIVDARVTPPICVRAGSVPWDRVIKSLNT